jgi:hypothetical protein
MDWRLDTEHSVHAIGLYLLYLRASNREPPSFHLFAARRIVRDEPAPKRMGDQASADFCARDASAVCAGEYFITLLYHGADGYRREDLSEEAWQNRMKTFAVFILEIAVRAVAAEAAEPLPKENAEQLFRRLMASDKPPANACYVLAAMLERKRVLKQVKNRVRRRRDRVLIYEQSTTGDVFLCPDPQLRLDELEAVQTKCRSSRSQAN